MKILKPVVFAFFVFLLAAPTTLSAQDEDTSELPFETDLTKVALAEPRTHGSLTIYPLPGTDLVTLHRAVADVLSAGDGPLIAQASVSCVDVTPAGIDKGAGARWVSAQTGIALAAMGGIGDSISDLAFLRLVARSGAPANASPAVRRAVERVSAESNGAGVIDLLRGWMDDPSAVARSQEDED